MLVYGEPFRYDLNASDLSGIDSWWINATEWFTIDEFGVITNDTSLTYGIYPIQVIVNDSQGNILLDAFRVIVPDEESPEWDEQPLDLVMEYSDHLNYDLNATDTSGTARWWVNDTEHFSITSNGVPRNDTRLYPGFYPLEVRAYDPFDNYCLTRITLTITDSLAPIIDSPSDITITQGDIGNSIEWHISDDNPALIEILMLGVVVQSFDWAESSTTFTYILGGLSVGVYNFSIRATDMASNVVSDTVWVIVDPPTSIGIVVVAASSLMVALILVVLYRSRN